MSVFAAVMTGKAAGAIAAIDVFGDGARRILDQVFRPAGTGKAQFKPGAILLGTIVDGEQAIDQVTIGCRGPESFAINCHGNPLIVEMIMQLLQRRGAELLGAEELLTKMLTARQSLNAIAIEAELARLNAKTLTGTKIIANQVRAGLDAKATQWLKDNNADSLERITSEAKQILANSERAKLIIAGCTIVLAGPPNSGKSTLLNCLAGRDKAIVTDIEGTTRDWVSAECPIEPILATLIDTAGLSEALAGAVEKAARQATTQILADADLVLLVLDNSRAGPQPGQTLLERIASKKVLTVLNKCDLPAAFDAAELPANLNETVQISAKLGTGIDTLKEGILRITAAVDFDPNTPVVFTDRQKTLLIQLTTAKSAHDARAIISELLNGEIHGGLRPPKQMAGGK